MKKVKNKLRVQADYNSDGLWLNGGAVTISQIRLSAEAKEMIRQWIAKYSEQINWETGENIKITDQFRTEYFMLENQVFSIIKKELATQYELIFIRADL